MTPKSLQSRLKIAKNAKFGSTETVGAALRQAQITIYLGDEVQPSMGSPVTTGLRVFIDRSTPVSLHVDYQYTKTRTQARTVGDTLIDLEIGLSGLDEVTPPLDTELYDNIEIHVKRVRQDIEIEEDIVPFETVFQPDRNLLIDTQQMINPGAEGITRRRERVRYEDDGEVSRVLEDTWIAQEPAQRVIAYGQRIEPNNVTMPDGQTITYWRRIRMKATSYSAGTAGVSPDQPYYGRTYTGDVMRKGIVAVDPQVIPLRSKVYIPSYGYGDALDTGSAIRARRIDLGYDDDNLVLWNSWVDVYVLWPPPPEYQITWVLPNWPPVPR
ncbi:G5 domain-containing protein [Chloroflexi bacterium TSY]|nr:G5 domain-containing protein [Chloroflexi bacterium TSY]